MQARPLMMSGVALAAVLGMWAWLRADDAAPAPVGAAVEAAAEPNLQSPGAAASLGWQMPTAPTTAPPVPLAAPFAPARASYAVPITVAAPQRMLVGEMKELLIGLGTNAGVNEISFSVQFDADVLQVRAGTQGDWAIGRGLSPHFAAEISGAEDRVQIRSSAPGQRAGAQGGSVAIVQFQAVAPGTTSVLITDLVVKDLAGRSLPSAVSASNLQLTVDSPAPAEPDPRRQRRGGPIEATPAEAAPDGE